MDPPILNACLFKFSDKVDEVDSFYFYYIKALNRAYDKMLDHFYSLLDSCMNDRNESKFRQIMVALRMFAHEIKYAIHRKTHLKDKLILKNSKIDRKKGIQWQQTVKMRKER